jgi:transposase
MSWTALHSTGIFVGQCGEEDTMEDVVVVGVDLAKSVFQVHGIDAQGVVVLRRKLNRSKLLSFFAMLPRCLIGMETCASANYWARELMALGHEVRLMPPQYVKPYVKRSKNDASDAEAICEAVTRPTMRFVGVKSPEQQSVLVLHRTRSILTRQRTQTGNAIRAHLAGIVAPVGRQGLDRLVAVIADESDARVPASARACVAMLVDQYRLVLTHLRETDRAIRTHARASELGRRLQEIPGVGPLVASALVATVPDPKLFRSGRSLSAWLGLVPRQNSSGEGAPRRHHQGWRYLSSQDDVRRCHGRDPPRRAVRHTQAVADQAPEPAASAGRCDRIGEQDRARRLGADDQRRALPRAGGRMS